MRGVCLSARECAALTDPSTSVMRWAGAVRRGFSDRLMVRYAELHALCAIAIPMLMSERAIRGLGIPALGFNVLDFCVAAMIPAILLRRSEVMERLYCRRRFVTYGVWFVVIAGVVGLAKGYVDGYPLRTALRDFRFYFYLPVMYHFSGLFGDVGQLRRLAIGWMGVAVLHRWMVYEGFLVYIYSAPGLQPKPQMFQSLVAFASTHHVPLKSYFPMLIGVALLLVASRHFSLGTKVVLALWIAFELVVLGFSYNRSSYLAVLGAFVGTMVIVAGVRVLSVGGAIRLAGRLALFWSGVVLLTVAVFFLISVLHSLDPPMAMRHIGARVWSSVRGIVGSAEMQDLDASVRERMEGWQIALRDVAGQPITGTGLGNSGTYLRAMAFHNIYLWMAASVGAPAAIVFVFAIVACGMTCLRSLRFTSDSSPLPGYWVGFLACMCALSIVGVFAPYITNFVHLTEWGFVLGLLRGLSNGGMTLEGKSPGGTWRPREAEVAMATGRM